MRFGAGGEARSIRSDSAVPSAFLEGIAGTGLFSQATGCLKKASDLQAVPPLAERRSLEFRRGSL